MHFRRRTLLPRSPMDILCFLLVVILVPIGFVFELTVVLPDFHAPFGFFYIFTWLLAIFVLFNLQGNWLTCMLVDTSIKYEILTPPAEEPLRKQWHVCAECETLSPPRSWHCQICKTCILKRDHHCNFTGCCIGHKNYRYFLYFMIYMALGNAYAIAYNSFYFWYVHADQYLNLFTLMKLAFPMVIFTMDFSICDLYLFLYAFNLFALAYSVILICFHMPTILRGAVSFDRKSTTYDLGKIRNLEMVLGKRWHLTWISPFIKSELPHDGVHWETLLEQSIKNR